MFLILGTVSKSKKIGTSDSQCTCANCHNQMQWDKLKEKLFFSLFWIPLIPLKSTYYKSCPVCTWKIRMKKNDLNLV